MLRALLTLPLLFLSSVVFAGFSPSSTPAGPNGVRATVDLPASQHMRNVGGSDGAGLCVFTSIQHAARWQNIIDLEGYREWMRRRPGGGYPQKVDSTLKAYCREKGSPVPDYVQHTGGDDGFLDLAMKTGRCPCVTYAGSDDFYSRGIDHMVNLVYLDSDQAAILDNNRPGTWLWMTRREFLQRWRARGGGWAVVFLSSPPPPHTESPVAADESPPPGQTVFGQWGGGACPAPAAGRPLLHPLANPFAPQMGGAAQTPTWKKEGIYYRLGNQGVYHPESGLWCPFLPQMNSWGEWAAPPKGLALPTGAKACDCDCCKPTCGCGPGMKDPDCICYPCPAEKGKQAAHADAGADEPLTGVIPERIHDSPLYSLSGVPVTKEEAHAAMSGSGSLVDDSDRWHVTVVGDQSFRDRVKADLAKLPADVKAKFHLQAYPTDHWAVAAFNLKEGVTLRKQAGMSRIAAEAAAVAKKDYSPESLNKMCPFAPKPTPPTPPVPGPGPDQPTPQPDKPESAGWWLALALAAILALFRRK